ncbi:MAG TPA: mandelate racemase/muconate lactonizing enzyme family protein [Candidatus Limnocylindrales bacterium]|nr:mandelate racemase/muconate lactonizing enzyme family protein [Candidatus Limnocylindrales bacterium]
MTRVAGLAVERLRVPFREPVRFGSLSAWARVVGLVRMTTDDGREGFGEIGGLVVAEDTIDAVELLDDGLRGLEVGDLPGLDRALAGLLPPIAQARELRAALDAAMLDLEGQAIGSPMVALFGGEPRGVRVNGLLLAGHEDDDTLVARALELCERGLTTIKVKRAPGARDVGHALQLVRDAVGPDVALRLDLNGDLTEAGACEWLATLEGVGLEYVEQPIPPELGPDALARVRAAAPMPVAADEAVTDPDAAAELLLAGACDVVVVKPARVGGPRAAHDIVTAATEAGLIATVSTLYETGVGIAAALHVAAAAPGDRAHGLGTIGLLEDDLVADGLEIRDGRMHVPTAPGLGIGIDRAALAWYALP